MKIWFNHRRGDADDIAGQLRDKLPILDRDKNIVLDVDAVGPGQDWKAAIENAIEACDVVVAVIGTNWLTSVDDKGVQRLANEDDRVAFELEAAHRQGRPVIPVIVQEAPLPRERDLPERLRWLPHLDFVFFGDRATSGGLRDVDHELRRRVPKPPAALAPDSPPTAPEQAPEPNGGLVWDAYFGEYVDHGAAVDAIVDFYRALNEFHIAGGGNGLVIDGWKLFSLADVPVGVA